MKEVKDQLRKKHPQGDGWKRAESLSEEPKEEVEEEEEEEETKVTFSEKQVERALRSFPKGTAAGGWMRWTARWEMAGRSC